MGVFFVDENVQIGLDHRVAMSRLCFGPVIKNNHKAKIKHAKKASGKIEEIDILRAVASLSEAEAEDDNLKLNDSSSNSSTGSATGMSDSVSSESSNENDAQ